jgi:ribose/xylose/arabinose/galactoside ABC-type transport system permease subunit
VWIFYVLQAGLIHLHFEAFWQQIATGTVIIVAVWLDYLQRRAEASRKSTLDVSRKRRLWSRAGIGS